MNKRFSSLSQIRSAISESSITLPELVRHYLNNIEAGKNLNAFLEVFENEALESAEIIQNKILNHQAGKLAGMVIAIKDNIVFKNHESNASSKILKGFKSLFSATVVERLIAEDAIIIGRTNCDEFAMGASNENSAFGPVLNAADTSRVPGGSSGGSAVAVQADMCLAALGSDTGGSIRQPAAFTGIYGLYPTYGAISRWGLIAFASSFDQIGPFTSSAEDMALLLNVIGGSDQHDATMIQNHQFDIQLDSSVKPLKIAYIKDCLEHPGLEPEIKSASLSFIELLQSKGHSVEGIDFPYLDQMVPCYQVLTTAEASSNLSRFSGLTYGYRSPDAVDLESTFKKSRSQGFGPEVKRRIMLGTFVLTSDYYDAYYTKAQKVRRLIRNKTMDIFKSYDIIITPTTSTVAFKVGEKSSNPIAMYLADLFTVQANLAGIPGLSIPYGLHPGNQMPIGMQLMGKPLEEGTLLKLAASLN
ncbi:MAG: Asp-tRNA(Asn)/Glu-tRNA(Gln) amidotransferase subunit GatA [Bacteroidetes bacterium]|nr:Asp-tRNA(Asn)/Glu-tRNA(Gln) amidotransferase subunit GatA [Bacteroidota bacterium]